jgi:glucose-6-phosphate-specific signal transduction histidine kinase
MGYIAFISMFALDVFGQGFGFWDTLAALVIHLLPTFVLILTLILAWRWEWVGAVLFGSAGALYTLTVLPKSNLSSEVKLIWCMSIAVPAFIIAGLFFFNWLRHDELRKKR